jgi:hypothetical protein
MEFEVQAKTNNANDIDIFLPVESLDKAFEVAEQQKTVENCYVFIVRKCSKTNDYPFQLHKWQRCEYSGINEWEETNSFTIFLGKYPQYDPETGKSCL